MREKINEELLLYLSNKISKQGLYKWAIGVLHELLENVVSLEYLKMLPIVEELSKMEDMDDVQIIGLWNLGYDLENEDADMKFALKSTVCIGEDMEEILEEEILNKIISLVDCYNGKRCVYVQVWFHMDTEDISIHL